MKGLEICMSTINDAELNFPTSKVGSKPYQIPNSINIPINIFHYFGFTLMSKIPKKKKLQKTIR